MVFVGHGLSSDTVFVYHGPPSKIVGFTWTFVRHGLRPKPLRQPQDESPWSKTKPASFGIAHGLHPTRCAIGRRASASAPSEGATRPVLAPSAATAAGINSLRCPFAQRHKERHAAAAAAGVRLVWAKAEAWPLPWRRRRPSWPVSVRPRLRPNPKAPSAQWLPRDERGLLHDTGTQSCKNVISRGFAMSRFLEPHLRR